MLNASNLSLFLISTFILAITPGPDTLYVVSRSVGQGRNAGLASALGVFVGNLGHTLAAAIGLSAVLMTSALAFMVVKYAGAAYLIYLGVRAILSGDRPTSAQELQEVNLWKAFAQGAVTNLLNPKAALFFLAFVPQFVDPSRGSVALQSIVLGSIIAVSSSAYLMGLAAVVDSMRSRLNIRPRWKKLQAKLTGSLFIALGLRLAIAEQK
ncbi:MAG: LysE family translocator [Elainellaceae cyanobacterium]